MPKTTFDPLLHGYQFQNGSPLPAAYAASAAASAFLTFGIAAATAAAIGPNVAPLGVCGGMSWTALDYYYYGKERVPSYDNRSFPQGVLVRGVRLQPNASNLYDYIWRRQVESAMANGGGFLLAASRSPNTAVQYARLQALLDAGQPVPLALPARSNLVWEGHHVVAFHYQEVGGLREVLVYDCNYPRTTCLLRIHADDQVEEFAATAKNGRWTSQGASLNHWKGFWIADGYRPEPPPADLDDIAIAGDIDVPVALDSQHDFKVRFLVCNVGEFETRIHAVGLRLHGSVTPAASRVLVPGGRLAVGQRFDVEITVPRQNAGSHEIEPVYFTGPQDPPRSFGVQRRIAVGRAFTAGSWLLVGALNPGPLAGRVLGALLSGPSLLEPTKPRTYEVKSYKLGVKVVVEDDLGGGTFAEPMTKLSAILDGGSLVSPKVTLGPRAATLEATYAPIPGQGATLLRLTATDSAGNTFEKAVAVPCADRVTVPHVDLNHVVPDLRHDPFGGRVGITPIASILGGQPG
jgi:hypothetical protein